MFSRMLTRRITSGSSLARFAQGTVPSPRAASNRLPKLPAFAVSASIADTATSTPALAATSAPSLDHLPILETLEAIPNFDAAAIPPRAIPKPPAKVGITTPEMSLIVSDHFPSCSGNHLYQFSLRGCRAGIKPIRSAIVSPTPTTGAATICPSESGLLASSSAFFCAAA